MVIVVNWRQRAKFDSPTIGRKQSITNHQAPYAGGKEKATMPNKPSIAFTEAEVRTAFIIGIATGHSIGEIMDRVITVTANNRTEIDRVTGVQKPVDGTSQLAIALESLRNAGYIANR